MPLSWGERKRLLRLTGVAEQVLEAARTPREPDASAALQQQLTSLADEVHAILADGDTALASEFGRLIPVADTSLPADLRAAALTGWLKAELTVESLDETRRQQALVEPPPAPRRKHTIGFKLRSPITREPEPGGS